MTENTERENLTVSSVKAVVRFVVGAGASKIAKDIISNNVTPRNKADKVCVSTASVVIGMSVDKHLGTFTDSYIDDMHEQFKKQRETRKVKLHPALKARYIKKS